jgi:hypothetical protein
MRIPVNGNHYHITTPLEIFLNQLLLGDGHVPQQLAVQAPKSKNPSANAGVFQFQMVARGGIDQD